MLAETHRRARSSLVDYSFHQIITDPTDEVVAVDIPAIVASGIRSLKVFMTYDAARLDDRAFLRVLAAARRAGALVTVHCENYEAIGWMTEQLLAQGLTTPKYHAWSRPKVVEREATYRAMALAELVDQPIQIFHVSCAEVAEEVARAQRRGLKVWAETCPQYFVLTAGDMDRAGPRGRKIHVQPAAARPRRPRGAVGGGAARHLGVISSDHSAYDFTGERNSKAQAGPDATFRDIPNGVPGVGSRLPIVFSEGVAKDRIDLATFVRVTATNPARLFGLYPQKGTSRSGPTRI